MLPVFAEIIPPNSYGLDPFGGSGTTGKVSLALGRNYIGVDLCIQYLENLSTERMSNLQTEMTF